MNTTPHPTTQTPRPDRIIGRFLVFLGVLAQIGGGYFGFIYLMGHHHDIAPPSDGVLMHMLIFGGVLTIMLGLALCARAKKRSKLWGLWGLLSLLTWVGWIILLIIFSRLEDRVESEPSE